MRARKSDGNALGVLDDVVVGTEFVGLSGHLSLMKGEASPGTCHTLGGAHNFDDGIRDLCHSEDGGDGIYSALIVA